MEIIIRIDYHPLERSFVSPLLLFLVLLSHFQTGISLDSLNPVSSENNQKLILSTTEGGSNIKVAFLAIESAYQVVETYDFFIPDVDVVCDCQCTYNNIHHGCSFYNECDRLMNSTTSCTVHTIIDINYNLCSQSFILCCHMYFTKTKLMKPFKALYLKYHQAFLKLNIISKSDKSQADEYNVSVSKNVKHILVSPDKILHISEFAQVDPLPESWYFIEEDSNELQYTDAINGVDEQNLDKIGWFQYRIGEKRLSRVSSSELEKRLEVSISYCHSIHSKYEWKLNASYYVRNSLMHIHENEQKNISESFNDMIKISVELNEEKIKIRLINHSSVNISLSNATLFPFLFTTTIKDTTLYLNFIKGNGTFYVQLLSTHWKDLETFFTKFTENIIQIHKIKYNLFWVCVSQNSQQLCQKLIYPDGRISSSITPAGIISIIGVLIAVTIILVFIWKRRRQRMSKRRNVNDAKELEPLSSDSTISNVHSTFTKYFCWKRSSRILKMSRIMSIEERETQNETNETPSSSFAGNGSFGISKMYNSIWKEVRGTRNETNEMPSTSLRGHGSFRIPKVSINISKQEGETRNETYATPSTSLGGNGSFGFPKTYKSLSANEKRLENETEAKRTISGRHYPFEISDTFKTISTGERGTKNETREMPSTSLFRNGSLEIPEMSKSISKEETRTQIETYAKPSTSFGGNVSFEISDTFKTMSTGERGTKNETREMPSTSLDRNGSLDGCVTRGEMQIISTMVRVNELTKLTIELNIDESTKEDIQRTCNLNNLSFSDVIYKLLDKWKERNGMEAKKCTLKRVLLAMERKDIADKVFSKIPEMSKSISKEETRTQNETYITPSTSFGANGSFDGCVTRREMQTISTMVRVNELTKLTIELNLDESTKEDIQRTCNLNNLSFSDVIYKLLDKWKERNGKEAKKCTLKRVLLAMERKDIADKVFSTLPETVDRMLMQEPYQGIQRRIEDGQRERYGNIELPQVNWTNIILPLEELYVNLELLTSSDDYYKDGKPMQMKELFRSINGIEPVRILIEGGPGFGKTTLCLKLLSDWGLKKDYISSKFKMVFLFELRYFKPKDSIESVLKRECEAVGVYGDEGIRCVEAFEKETLLILDGFDEMNEESKRKFLPLFLKNVYRSMYVLVTSRRGFFQMENKKGSEHVGVLTKKNEIENVVKNWGKRVLIKGMTTDKIEPFMRKYLQKDYRELEVKINSITGGEMKKVFKCPLFLILLAMMLEEKPLVKVNTKTTLYKEFFNFVVRRNLVREKKISDDEEVDVFDGSGKHLAVQLIDIFGQFAKKSLCENKLFFRENEILQCCKDEIVLKLGFLTKIPKMEGWKRENFHQPIHKSFLEFAAAFATWNLFKKDEQKFKREIQRMGENGLKPTHDSLFYNFLGGLMNNQASALFESLIHYSSLFNIENLCFTNILLEIQDIPSFFLSFESILDSFIPFHYSIPGVKGLTRDYFLSDIHSLIMKHSSDRQLIKLLEWNPHFSINFSGKLYFDCLQLNLTKEPFKISSKEKIHLIKCKNIIYKFTDSFKVNQWDDFVSVFNSIQSENVHLFFDNRSNEINSVMLNLLRQELIEGRWKQKNINRVRFKLNEINDRNSLSLLVELVKKNRIKDGVYLKIYRSREGRESEIDFVKRETEELFNSILQSKTIQEFILDNDDISSPDIDFKRFQNSQLKRINFSGRLNVLNSDKNKTENYSLEEVQMTSDVYENNFSFIQNFRGIKYLSCRFNCFNSLLEMEWPGLKVIEELELHDFNSELHDFNSESLQLFLNSVSELTNLQVLSLNVRFLEIIPSNRFKRLFVYFFSALHLRICEFLSIQNIELFSFLTGALMEGMKKKEEKEENNPTMDSNEGKKVYLQELVIQMHYYESEQLNGIQWIQSMLRNQHLQQCYFVDYYLNEVESLFPPEDNFRILREIDGMNPNNSRRSQFHYHWFEFKKKYCIKYIN